MEVGRIVEYIEQQQILCAVVLEDQEQRVRLLNEKGRELNQKCSRLCHASSTRISVNRDRDRLVQELKETAARRRAIQENIDIQELWEVLTPLNEWVDLETMTGLCFPDNANGDHEAAVIRACFESRVYFRFDYDSFFPHSPEEVEAKIARQKQSEERARLVADGGEWFRRLLSGQSPPPPESFHYITEALKSYYLFGKESRFYSFAKALVAKAGVENPDVIFDALVRLGVWTTNQNLELDRFEIAT
ncbi:MAG TPA: exoribonuclease II, partial [Desulfosalsimonadaceae bacterium]|nr:exoribonuclease II [Desulfosalsimonadaceae bacterium]